MIIFLNGTSSSGKSSIARELRKILKEPYFLFGVDYFLDKSMPLVSNFEKKSDFRIILRSINAFNRSLKSLAECIDFLIIDHVLQDPAWLKEVARALRGKQTFFVGVQAPVEILEAREQKRRNRKPGTARAQIRKMRGYKYDLVVNTAELSPKACAQLIVSHLHPGKSLSRYAK